MSNVVYSVSLALQRLDSSGQRISFGQLRKLLETGIGPTAATVSDADLHGALIELYRTGHSAAPAVVPYMAVTCSPLPAGWIPLEDFLGER